MALSLTLPSSNLKLPITVSEPSSLGDIPYTITRTQIITDNIIYKEMMPAKLYYVFMHTCVNHEIIINESIMKCKQHTPCSHHLTKRCHNKDTPCALNNFFITSLKYQIISFSWTNFSSTGFFVLITYYLILFVKFTIS